MLRAVITGLGMVTPLGIGVGKSWQALCAGKSGIGRVTRFDATTMHTKVGGEVKDFNPKDFLTDKLARRTDRCQQFALAAARMALEDSRLRITSDIAERVGVVTGTAFGGLETTVNGQNMYMNGDRNDISPFLVPMLLTSMASGQIAMQFGAKGPNFSLTTACAASTHAVGDACRIIQHGEADVVIVGGAEAAQVPILYHAFGIMGATTEWTGDPQKASRPFDADRDGFVPAEGAAVLILEELQHALRRNASIVAEVVGYATTADAYHITSPAPDGEGAARCMRLALLDAGVKPEDVDYVNAHGTSTKLNDSTETAALKSVFGAHAASISVSSNKSMLGHTMGASGAIEAAFTVLTIRDGIIPPTINYAKTDPECDLDYVPNVARKARVQTALSSSFGFGGTNGVLVLRGYADKPQRGPDIDG